MIYMLEKKNDTNNQKDDLELVLLRIANNNFELDLIKSLLDEDNISYIIKEPGIGGYMKIITGQTLYGASVLVEKSFYEKANAVLEGIIIGE
ncbi:putative signal transducing protein [Tissierella sp.]|uniref:putative signal transducing protein n=1 Tax=Tissierella sp. TaxID=41274 RepID=UPI00285E79D1|nr:DUF2007 domain-containing protein [Tissierella sp.]MDR7854974.1 DUF2007 domain-containing protein [Tissierella sp.]